MPGGTEVNQEEPQGSQYNRIRPKHHPNTSQQCSHTNQCAQSHNQIQLFIIHHTNSFCNTTAQLGPRLPHH